MIENIPLISRLRSFLYFHSTMDTGNSIKNWAEDDRPREKMLQKGAAALSDAELLGILIATGTRERSAIALARDVLALSGNNLHELGRLSVQQLQQVKGIGRAKAITISAALELGRRRQTGDTAPRLVIKTSRDAANIVIPLLRDLNHETLCVLYLNNSNKFTRHELVSTGGLSATVIDKRVILKNCLLHNAPKIILAHNHPSGAKDPSKADIDMTRDLKTAAALMDIQLLDHIIVAGTDFVSLADEGLM